jgi:predicted ATPase/DNA-binding XRE family transcriptional regulator
MTVGARHTWDARRIASLREKHGWTQEKLAERSGLSVRTIRNLELGLVQNPRRSSVDLLAHALGVEVAEQQQYLLAADVPGGAAWCGPRPPASALVGDRGEHERLAETVRANRLTTFLGPGGIGKTRLALHVAAEIGHLFQHGVAVVELADLAPERQSPGSQAGAVLARVRRQLRWGRPASSTDSTMDIDRDLNLLVVLDNAEHLPGGVTAVVRDLLGSHPGMQVLITARRRLTERLGANQQIQPLSGTAAVELVLRHAGTGSAAPADLDSDVPLIGDLCRRLGGVPRHLEFAAERMRTIPVQRLLAYGPTMDMLWSNDHALARHQRSVADSIRWNMDLLGDQHGRLLAQLAAVPAGRFTVDDVAMSARVAVTAANPLTLLADLHETSLVVADADDRYHYRLAPFVAEVVDRTRSAHDELARRRAAVAS